MRNSNPIFKSETFERSAYQPGQEVMTVNGTIAKALNLLLLLVISSAATFGYLAMTHKFQTVAIFAGVGIVATLILGLVACFKPQTCHITAPLYAVFEGFALGSIAMVLSLKYGGIALQAVLLTFGVAGAMFGCYRFGLIKVTEKFKAVVMAATMGVFLVMMANLLLGMFGINLPFRSGGLIGIAFSLIVIVVAALNLVLDFDRIEEGAAQGLPVQMEWFAAFGLMVTMVWLYWEILRLVMILRGSDD